MLSAEKEKYLKRLEMSSYKYGEPMVGFEPTASGLQNRCSATELHRHIGSVTGYAVMCQRI